MALIHAMTTIILIPSYRPTIELWKLINNLLRLSHYQIVIVDDGNQDSTDQAFFAKLAQESQVFILHHVHNQGKGAALKTGIASLALVSVLVGVFAIAGTDSAYTQYLWYLSSGLTSLGLLGILPMLVKAIGVGQEIPN